MGDAHRVCPSLYWEDAYEVNGGNEKECDKKTKGEFFAYEM